MSVIARSVLMLFLSGALVVGLSACATTSENQSPPDATPLLEGTSWEVQSVTGHSPIDSLDTTTIDFRDDGALTGFAGVLRYRGRYRAKGETLRVHGIRINRRFGQPALEDDERHFLRVLGDARGFDIDASGKLMIHARSGRTIIASPVD